MEEFFLCFFGFLLFIAIMSLIGVSKNKDYPNTSNVEASFTGYHYSHSGAYYQFNEVGMWEGEWRRGTLLLREKDLIIYPFGATRGSNFSVKFEYKDLTALWRNSSNEIIIEFYKSNILYYLKLKHVYSIHSFTLVIQGLVDENIFRLYEKHQDVKLRYDIVHTVKQELTGNWKLGITKGLYLSPQRLIIFNAWRRDGRIIRLESISEIEAIPRLDTENTGILRFRAEEEILSFDLEDYVEFAKDLALVAGAAQDIHIEAKIGEIQKKKDEN